MATEAAKATALLRKKNDPKATNWAYGQESHASQMHSVRPERGRARCMQPRAPTGVYHSGESDLSWIKISGALTRRAARRADVRERLCGRLCDKQSAQAQP